MPGDSHPFARILQLLEWRLVKCILSDFRISEMFLGLHYIPVSYSTKNESKKRKK
jgi:hypothetical protein